MPNQDAVQDKNQVYSMLAATGTAGTAEAIRLVADADGNLGVNIISGEIVASLGTVGVLNAGSVVVTNGTIASPTSFEGGTVAIGTSAVEITFTGVTKGVMITADHANGTMVYLGGSTVAQSGSSAIVSLYPGESCSFDLNDSGVAVYCVGGTTGQKVYKFALT